LDEEHVLQQLNAAVTAATSAVEADKNGDYGVAISRYREAVELLDTQTENVPQVNRNLLTEKAAKYKKRIDILERLLSLSSPRTTKESSKDGSWIFSEEQIHADSTNVPSAPPSSPYKRTFWLIGVLADTMNTGGFLSPKVYISRTVWYQPGAKFNAIQHKVAALQSLSEAMIKLELVEVENKEQTCKQLADFCVVLDSIQDTLSKHFTFIKDSSSVKKNILKKIGSGMAQGAGRVKTGLTHAGKSDDHYVDLLKENLMKAVVLEGWLDHFEKGGVTEAVELLQRVSDFFYSVILAFVIRDFSMLLKRHMKKCNESFFEN